MKKLIALTLATVMLLGVAIVPAQAGAADDEAMTHFTIKSDQGTDFKLEPATNHAAVQLYNRGEMDGEAIYSESDIVTSHNKISTTESVVIKNAADTAQYWQVQVVPFSYIDGKYAAGHGTGDNMEWMYYLQEDGTFKSTDAGNDAGFTIQPGAALSFRLNGVYYGYEAQPVTVSEDAYFMVYAFMNYPDTEDHTVYEYNYVFKMDGQAVTIIDKTEDSNDKPAAAIDMTDTGADKADAGSMIDMASSPEYLSDYGYVYNFSIRNTTTEDMKGCYALLSYMPEKYKVHGSDSDYYAAEISPIDVSIAPGESENLKITSGFRLSNAVNIWVEFDSKAERDSFFRQEGLIAKASADGERYEFKGIAGESILAETFGIEL